VEQCAKEENADGCLLVAKDAVSPFKMMTLWLMYSTKK
jgi:hypothetical protein